MLEFGRLSKSLKALHAWQSRRQDIGLLNKEKGDKNSMFRKVLHAVRNEVTFHFEKAAIVSAISRLEVTGDVEFAYGETSENFPTLFMGSLTISY